MKNAIISTVLVLISGCSFLNQGNILFSQKLPGGRIIQLTQIGGGAASEGAIWVSEKKKNKNILIDRLDGYNTLDNIPGLQQLNDSIIIITLIDTVINMRFKYRVNLNNRISPNDGSPGAKLFE